MAENRVGIVIDVQGGAEAARALDNIRGRSNDLSEAFGGTAKMATEVTTRVGETSKSFEVLERAARPIDALLGQISGGGVQLGRVFGALTSPMALTGEAIFAASVALFKLSESMVKIAQEQRQLSAVSGLSVSETKNLSDTFVLAGLNSDRFGAALFRVSQIVDSGGKEFERFGITVRDETGKLKEPGAVFLELRDKISQMGSAADRNQALMIAFGRAGRELAPFFDMSAAALGHLRDQAEHDAPWSQKNQDQVLEFIKQQGALKLAWEGLTTSLGVLVMGPLASMLAGFKWMLDERAKMAALGGGTSGVNQAPRMFNGSPGSIAPPAPSSSWSGDLPTNAAYAPISWAGQAPAVGTDLLAREIEMRRAIAEGGLAALRTSIAQQQLLIDSAVTQHTLTEREGMVARLGLIDTETVAARTFYAQRIADLKNAKDTDLVAIQQATNAQTMAMGALAVQRAAAANMVGKATLAESEARSAMIAAVAQAEEKSEETFVTSSRMGIQARLDAETQASGTTVDIFTSAQDQKLRAFRDGLEKQRLSATAQGLFLSDFEKTQATELKAFRDAQDSATATTEAQALATFIASTNTQTQAVEQAHAKELNDLDVLHQNELISEDDYQERLKRVNDTFRGQRRQAGVADLIAEQVRLAESEQEQGKYFAFLGTQFHLAALQAGTAYDAMRTGVQTFTQGATSGLSAFFDASSKQFLDFGELGKSVLASLTKAVADFAVQSALSFAGGFLGGGGGGLAGSLGASAGSALGVTGTLANLAKLVGLGGSTAAGASFDTGSFAVDQGVDMSALADAGIPFMATGGVIPGQPGAPVLMVGHAGELVVPQSSGGSGSATDPTLAALSEFLGLAKLGLNVASLANKFGFFTPAVTSASTAASAAGLSGEFLSASLEGATLASGAAGAGLEGAAVAAETAGTALSALGPITMGVAAVLQGVMGAISANARVEMMNAKGRLGTEMVNARIAASGVDAAFQAGDVNARSVGEFFTSFYGPGATTAADAEFVAAKLTAGGIFPSGLTAINELAKLRDPSADNTNAMNLQHQAASGNDGGGGGFAMGGTVPGRYPGQPVRVTAHAGEEFAGVGQFRRSSGGGYNLALHFNLLDASQLTDQTVNRLARRFSSELARFDANRRSRN